MKFLDIDMDYFQTKVYFGKEDSPIHRKDSACEVWDQERFRKFLESHLGLDKQKKVKGRIVNYHKEVYDFAEYLIARGALSIPFDIMHIDAHLDMDATPSCERVRFLNSITSEQKQLFQEGKLFSNSQNRKFINSGSYLLAMALSQWTNNIIYEFPATSCYDGSSDPGFPVFVKETGRIGELYIDKFGKIQGEYIKIHATSGMGAAVTHPWDYMAVAISPPYTIKQIKGLVEIIREYMEII